MDLGAQEAERLQTSKTRVRFACVVQEQVLCRSDGAHGERDEIRERRKGVVRELQVHLVRGESDVQRSELSERGDATDAL